MIKLKMNKGFRQNTIQKKMPGTIRVAGRFLSVNNEGYVWRIEIDLRYFVVHIVAWPGRSFERYGCSRYRVIRSQALS